MRRAWLIVLCASCAAPPDVRDAIARLDDDDIAVREEAQRELTAMGADAEPALRAAHPASPEQAGRIEEILWTIEVRRQVRLEPVWWESSLIAPPEHEWRIEGAADRYGRPVSWTYGCVSLERKDETVSVVLDLIVEAYVFDGDPRVVWGTAIVRIEGRPSVELPFRFVR